jgi:hypothetical protein
VAVLALAIAHAAAVSSVGLTLITRSILGPASRNEHATPVLSLDRPTQMLTVRPTLDLIAWPPAFDVAANRFHDGEGGRTIGIAMGLGCVLSAGDPAIYHVILGIRNRTQRHGIGNRVRAPRIVTPYLRAASFTSSPEERVADRPWRRTERHVWRYAGVTAAKREKYGGFGGLETTVSVEAFFGHVSQVVDL